MALHATLSPSSAERWISCPASVLLAESVPEGKESVYAREGTACHALAELRARWEILGTGSLKSHQAELAEWRKHYDIADDAFAEMTEHVDGYITFLRERLASTPDSQLLLEQRLPTGVPNCWGTSDAIIVSPTVVESVDLKYGMGVRVEAVGNPQLRLYGVGALEAFGDLLGNVEVVRLTVFQPRLDHVATEEMSAAELRKWRDSILPIAEEAMQPGARFGPSEDACRWCPLSGQCKAQMEWATARDFGLTAELMDEHELAAALDAIPGIRQWADAVEAYCLDRAYSEGKPIPGYKVVMSGGKRSIVDPDGAIEALKMLGFPEDAISRRMPRTLGDLEKLLKRGITVLDPYIKKGEGKPSLVPESDSRPAIDPEGQAATDFGGGS